MLQLAGTTGQVATLVDRAALYPNVVEKLLDVLRNAGATGQVTTPLGRGHHAAGQRLAALASGELDGCGWT